MGDSVTYNRDMHVSGLNIWYNYTINAYLAWGLVLWSVYVISRMYNIGVLVTLVMSQSSSKLQKSQEWYSHSE